MMSERPAPSSAISRRSTNTGTPSPSPLRMKRSAQAIGRIGDDRVQPHELTRAEEIDPAGDVRIRALIVDQVMRDDAPALRA